jgi:hypothetical protein
MSSSFSVLVLPATRTVIVAGAAGLAGAVVTVVAVTLRLDVGLPPLEPHADTPTAVAPPAASTATTTTSVLIASRLRRPRRADQPAPTVSPATPSRSAEPDRTCVRDH